jgi:hypothetical protein
MSFKCPICKQWKLTWLQRAWHLRWVHGWGVRGTDLTKGRGDTMMDTLGTLIIKKVHFAYCRSSGYLAPSRDSTFLVRVPSTRRAAFFIHRSLLSGGGRFVFRAVRPSPDETRRGKAARRDSIPGSTEEYPGQRTPCRGYRSTSELASRSSWGQTNEAASIEPGVQRHATTRG